jgi:hypothetical protein
MQKFTRSLTREIEVGGERVAVTLDEAGVTVRPVGARRPPHTVTWAGVLCAATASSAPSAEQVAAAVESLKKGAEKAAATPAPAAAPHSAPAPTPAPAPAHSEPAHAHAEHHTHAPAPAPHREH